MLFSRNQAVLPELNFFARREDFSGADPLVCSRPPGRLARRFEMPPQPDQGVGRRRGRLPYKHPTTFELRLRCFVGQAFSLQVGQKTAYWRARLRILQCVTERLTRTGVRGKPSTNGKRFRGARVSKRSLTVAPRSAETVFERVEKCLGGARVSKRLC